VEVLGATIAILEAGRVIARGTLPDLLAAHAEASVEVEFHGPAPDLGLTTEGVVRDGNRLRVPALDPAATAADLLGRLRPGDPPLAGIEVVHPTLDSVYLAVTGRRFAADGDATETETTDTTEADDVAVA
jgi:ABC-2 type transport system ATP-binding protein